MYFLIMYFFILTDLYCRIYPMVIVGAWTKKVIAEDDLDKQPMLTLVTCGVFIVVFAYEGFAVRALCLLHFGGYLHIHSVSLSVSPISIGPFCTRNTMNGAPCSNSSILPHLRFPFFYCPPSDWRIWKRMSISIV